MDLEIDLSETGGDTSQINLRPVLNERDLRQAQEIITEYIDALGVDVSFQDIAQELADLSHYYDLSNGGLLMLAFVDEQLAGCAGLRPFHKGDYINACEMKRLYVRPAFRGLGIGLGLAEVLIESAKTTGYEVLLLDTLDEQQAARELYQSLGFEEVPPYYYSPISGAHYLKVDLD